jgi:hypothetical protein
MSENKPPDIKAPVEIRPNSRDFGFVLIGFALGICIGSSLPYPFVLIFAMGLAITANHFINKYRPR